MGRILCIGQSALDYTASLSGHIIENRKYRIEELTESGGGPAYNASYLCGLWEAPVSLISRIGNDENGRKLMDMARSVHVDLDYLVQDEQFKTAYSYIFTNEKNGSRTLFNFPGKKGDDVCRLPQEEIDVILSDGHEPELTEQAAAAYPDTIVVVDAGSYRESTLRASKLADYLVCSEDFAAQYTGKNLTLEDWESCEAVFEQIEGINQKHVVITLGEAGLLYREHGKLTHMPAYRVKAVDTNGAGDIFHGAFAYGMYRKMNLKDILKMSSMASAISVQYPGSQSAIPELSVVKKKLEEVGEVFSSSI